MYYSRRCRSRNPLQQNRLRRSHLRSLRLLIVTLMACLLSATAFGAGFSIFEQGAKASGMAGAFVATADDPSAVFYNPAGIANQRELSVLARATFLQFTEQV